MVESIQIGAMAVNSAIKYFREGRNTAIVTGGDRTDIQLAALETAAHCLILTGRLYPSPLVVRRAEDMEIPILSVDYDTLTTVSVIERTLGQVRLHEPAKVTHVQEMMAERFDSDRLLSLLGCEPAAATA